MADCNDNIQKRGSSNPIQSKIVENDHGSGSSSGDNTIPSITCDATVAIGNVVRLSGTTIVNALADNTTNSKAIGICIAKSGATTCDVQVTGFTSSIFAGLVANSIYFLSDTTPGAITTTPPTASSTIVKVIGVPNSTTSLTMQISPGTRRA